MNLYYRINFKNRVLLYHKEIKTQLTPSKEQIIHISEAIRVSLVRQYRVNKNDVLRIEKTEYDKLSSK